MSSETKQILTTDGIPLEVSLKKAERKNKIKELCTDPKGGCVFWSAGAQPPELLVSGEVVMACLLYTSPSPRDNRVSRMPSSA